ncbi:hypothetical protein MHU86_22633 [Fragilaria crotonensis]|nr:hypothetical protein MHU86_22633 [Fragilaria crotonensis]
MMNVSFTLLTFGFIALAVFVCVSLHAADKNTSHQQLRKLSLADPRTVQTKPLPHQNHNTAAFTNPNSHHDGVTSTMQSNPTIQGISQSDPLQSLQNTVIHQQQQHLSPPLETSQLQPESYPVDSQGTVANAAAANQQIYTSQQNAMASPQETMSSQQGGMVSHPETMQSQHAMMPSQHAMMPSQHVSLTQSVDKNRNHHLEAQRLQKLLYSRNKNILTLGGSTTWGSKLDSRSSAYPYLIPTLLGPTWRSYNLAVRATDASYASQCIESMIRDGIQSAEDIEFDVILLEYSLNGLDGMPLLLKRLRRRFPKAVIVYVHLWSLRMSVDNAVTGVKPRDELSRGLPFKEADANINTMLADPSAKWAWAPKMKQDSEDIASSAEQQMHAIGGHIYRVPMPESLQIAFDEHWFGPDFHHLSSQGHAMVAEHLAKMLQDEDIVGAPKRLDIHGIPLAPDEDIGTWGEGDQCYSLCETGTHPDIRVDGGTVKNFVKNDKWAVSVGLTFGQPASIWFPNRMSTMQPVMLMIMSWGPGVYPKSRIDLESPGFENQSSMLDPLHPNPLNHVFHVTRTAHVGWANFGESRLTVDPIEDMQRPFRVIGIVMCGACMEMDETYMSNDSTHQRLGGTLPPPVLLPESPEMEEQQQHVSPDYQYDPSASSQYEENQSQSGVHVQQETTPAQENQSQGGVQVQQETPPAQENQSQGGVQVQQETTPAQENQSQGGVQVQQQQTTPAQENQSQGGVQVQQETTPAQENQSQGGVQVQQQQTTPAQENQSQGGVQVQQETTPAQENQSQGGVQVQQETTPAQENQSQGGVQVQQQQTTPAQENQSQSGVQEQQQVTPGAIEAFADSGMTTPQRPAARADYVNADQQTSTTI